MPVTPHLHGQGFLIKQDGRWHATPLLVALLFLEMIDIIFAVDSVPAIFAISHEPLVVFTSNGLALILIFVGLKMVWLNNLFDGTFLISWSLAIIGILLGGSVVASWLWPARPGHLVVRPKSDAAA